MPGGTSINPNDVSMSRNSAQFLKLSALTVAERGYWGGFCWISAWGMTDHGRGWWLKYRSRYSDVLIFEFFALDAFWFAVAAVKRVTTGK